ncbi:hypothetical protein C1H46_011589 [Malus baccata]|uniref:Pectate lyase superfamily protein domain-containing protein n=1 Tax=Malus baccata TaxID=106549 RepID=A0A540MWN0_MALBA|nr:hypothetical protein C1H46_011589 [Malus baccata]
MSHEVLNFAFYTNIGSLGVHNSQACVSNITVRNAVIRESDNGVRIKTWQGGTGCVSGILFENIQMENVLNCLLVDQYYCLSKGCLNQTSAVLVTDLTYRNIKGTYDVRTPPIHFACSDTVACRNITLSEVELYPHEGELMDDPFCWNAYGIQETATIPPIDCLQEGEPQVAAEETKNMPSLQTSLPPELANNVIRLYRECLRRVKYVGHRIVSMGGRRFGTNFHLRFRILEALLFLGFMSAMTVLFVVCGLTISDLFAAIPAFLPTGWALLLACVSNITVRNAVIRESDNGVRIKTWQGGTGCVSGILFENIQMENVLNCLLVDQYYCLSKGCLNQTSAVLVTDLTYRNIKGTYDVRTPPIHFACSDTVACRNITLSEVELYPHEGELMDDPFCWNAYGIQETATIPPIDCLQEGEPQVAAEVSEYTC